MVLAHSEYISDDVMGGVALVPEALQDLVGSVYVSAHTVRQHLLDQQRVGLITHLDRHTARYCKTIDIGVHYI